MVHVVDNHSVENVERTDGVERAYTTDLHLAHLAGSTRRRYRYAGHLTLQHLIDVGGGRLLGFLHVHHTDSTRQVGFLLRTVTDDDDVIEALHLGSHFHVDEATVTYLHYFIFVAQIGELQTLVGISLDDIVAVKTCDSHRLRVQRLYGDTDKRFTRGSISDSTLHVLSQRSQRQPQQDCQEQHCLPK